MRIENKRKIVEDLKARFFRSNAVILVDYQGLDVESLNLLRRKLREIGVEFQVAKNSLFIRASSGTPVEPLKDSFTGPSAVALCYGDPVAPAKVLTVFSSENNVFEIKTGVLADRLLSLSEIKTLASLPSRDILLARLLSTMSAVPVSLVTVLGGVARDLVNVLQAIKDQKDI